MLLGDFGLKVVYSPRLQQRFMSSFIKLYKHKPEEDDKDNIALFTPHDLKISIVLDVLDLIYSKRY